MLTDDCMQFLLELLRFDLSEDDRFWFSLIGLTLGCLGHSRNACMTFVCRG